MEGYQASTYGDAFADVYDEWYASSPETETDTQAAVVALTSLARAAAAEAGPLPALELGVGSGRLALPLAAAVHGTAGAVPLIGVDASTAMLTRLRAKDHNAAVPVVAADMAELPLGGDRAQFGLVFVAYNTLFNLPSAARQRHCLLEVARVLAPGGRLVVEAFVPPDDPVGHAAPPAGGLGSVEVRSVEMGRVVLTVSRHEPTEQSVTGQHIEITEAGIRLRPWHVRYAGPAELDAMAAEAGLTLDVRWRDWSGAPFDESSTAHVSVYVRAR